MSQCAVVLEKTLMTTTPIIIKLNPIIAGKSGISLKKTAPMIVIKTIPTPDQIA